MALTALYSDGMATKVKGSLSMGFLTEKDKCLERIIYT
jgi:hypothetical protein